jgi:hypothetical protein
MTVLTRLIVALIVVSFTSVAQAYNGPGSGASFLAALWSVLVGFVVVLSAILFWPVRAMLRRRRARRAAQISNAG